GAYRADPVSSGRRALAGLALTHLCLAARRTRDTVWPGKALQRFKDAGNMTDRFNALAALVSAGHELATPALQRFHAMFAGEPLVLDKWFALQAGAPDRGGYVFWCDRVIELDAINPQVAARLARSLDRWKKLVEPLRGAAREAIARIAAKPDLSNDVREVVTRALSD